MSGHKTHDLRRIALLVGNDLDRRETDAARQWVESCPECRRAWVRFRGCRDVLERSTRLGGEPYTSLWPTIDVRLRPSVLPAKPRRFNGWVPALTMAAACIVLMVVGQTAGDLRPEGTLATDRFAAPGHSALTILPVRYDPGRSASGTGENELLMPLDRQDDATDAALLSPAVWTRGPDVR